jgi:steroid delta-isomerase-like uncharacterized protein
MCTRFGFDSSATRFASKEKGAVCQNRQRRIGENAVSIAENKALVRRYYEDAPHNPDVCDVIFADRFLFHAIVHTGMAPQVIECTPDSEKTFYVHRRAAWGGWNVTIEEMIAEGDRVVVRWTSHGVHKGETHGLPPTGRRVTNSGVNIFRIADGKIAEVWDIWDRLWLWQQLGVLPELREAIARARDTVSSEQTSESG